MFSPDFSRKKNPKKKCVFPTPEKVQIVMGREKMQI
jgi:hypothetical protein